MSELLPCPFCGSRNVKMSGPDHWAYEGRTARLVECSDCEAMGPVEVDSESDEIAKELAAERWNTRHSPLETPT